MKIKILSILVIVLGVIIGCSSDDVSSNMPSNPQNSTCSNGYAGPYPCNNYDLIAHLPLTTFGGVGLAGNDSWGWTDSSTGKEYALICTTRGTSFVDITNAENPIFLGTLNTATGASTWRDIKVYNDYAFIVSEAQDHGMQIFDLTHLRDVSSAPQEFTADAHYTGFGNAHNIVINEESGYAYAVGSNTFSGGPHFINIQDPLNPFAAGGFSGYSHDAQVVTYNGPDTDYIGKEILIGSNVFEVGLFDVTDKSNPIEISTVNYSNIGYTHQGWFTSDMNYFILGDELDEVNYGSNTRTLIFDFTDLDNPIYFTDFFGTSQAIDHNGYVKDNLYYQANYTAGVTIYDISNIENNSVSKVGFFDTYPENNSTNFSGAWNVYPYFESGNIIISDINRGLFIIRKSGT
ncbi:regulator [Hanstruepera neustonica]|uniref:Regulator n=1 Tax=Hanstruepera neustonica TaxID=1445657 RepID=A0A2K1E3Y3_9FLAO|nr:choice-of-anchor B family protein [Hanstruepera neustonica]PNQ74994.1 regulator [Hanstruepera neustonica]